MVLSIGAENLGFSYGDHPVLRGLTLPPTASGEVTALCGPNATGKSTLLKCLAGLEHATGSVRLGGSDHPAPTDGASADGAPADGGNRARRRRPRQDDRVLYMPQDLPAASSLTVFEAVLLARQQQRRSRVGRVVTEEVEQVLASLGIDDLALRAVSALSGGQRQLVSLAQAVVRRPPVLLLDEPTSNLDLRNQLHLLGVISRIATTQPAAVLVTVHDLNLVGRFADRIVILHAGRVHSAGAPSEVITEEMLREVYQVEATVGETGDGTPTVHATRSL